MDQDTDQGTTAPEKQLYVGGHWLDGQEWFEVRDKLSGSVLASVPRCEDELFEMAVQAARDFTPAAARLAPADRSRLLTDWADRLAGLQNRLFRLLHRESAVPLAWAESEVIQSVEVLRQAAAEAERMGQEHGPPTAPGGHSDFSLAQPVGTVAALLPDQQPLFHAAQVVGAALATGCPLVIMAHPLAPLSVIHFLEAGAASGLPAGSINLIYGLVRDLGKKLASDPRINLLVTAGPQRDQATLSAVRSGRAMVAVGAGYGCALIDPSADITQTVTGLLGRRFRHPSFGRAAPYFILCPQGQTGRLKDGLAAGLQSLGGGGLSEASACVPWQTTDSIAQRAEDWLKSVVQTGGILVAGGERKGHYIEPAIVTAPAGHRRLAPPPAQAPFFIIDSYDKQPRRQLMRFPALEEACVFTSDMDRAMDWARLPDVPRVDVLSTHPGSSQVSSGTPQKHATKPADIEHDSYQTRRTLYYSSSPVPKPLVLGSRPLSAEDVVGVARSARRVRLATSTRLRIKRNRVALQQALSGGDALYGVNTGFGKLARTRITGQDLMRLQLNLVRSHAAGTGPEFPPDVVRAVLLLRAVSLSHGYSGVRPGSVETLLKLLNRDILPVVPSRGSVGASGDLAPLAHIALALVGEGHVHSGGRRTTAKTALRSARIKAVKLTEKEGLAFINGTQALTSVGLLALWDAYVLWEAALVAGALSTEAIKGSDVPFDDRFARIRPHPGHRLAAARLRSYLRGSAIRKSHLHCDRVQDPYSFRCQPQVMGAVRDALDYVRDVLLREINSVTDNPIVDTRTGAVLSGGNFHGQPVAMALDHLTLALTTLANMSERRTAALMDPVQSGLPAFLAAHPGRDSGLMIWQVTAAALASENKTASTPSSADTIPTSANQEDFVCMGMGAALKAADALDRSRRVVAIELLADRFALEHQQPLKPGKKLAPFIGHLEAAVPRVRTDRNFQPDYAGVLKLVETEFHGSLPHNRW